MVITQSSTYLLVDRFDLSFSRITADQELTLLRTGLLEELARTTEQPER
jgi:hypothetical protein